MVKIEQFLVGEMDNFTYLIIDEKNKNSIMIDPSWNLDIIFNFLKKSTKFFLQKSKAVNLDGMT